MRPTAFLSGSVLAFRSIRRSVFRTIWASRCRDKRRAASRSDLSASFDSFFPAAKGRTKRHRLRSRLKILRNSWTEAGAFRSLDAARRIASFTWASAIFAQVAEASRRRFGLIFYPNLTQIFEEYSIKNQLCSKRAGLLRARSVLQMPENSFQKPVGRNIRRAIFLGFSGVALYYSCLTIGLGKNEKSRYERRVRETGRHEENSAEAD